MSKPRLFTRRWFLVNQIQEDFFWAGLFLAVLWGVIILGVCYAQWSINQ